MENLATERTAENIVDDPGEGERPTYDELLKLVFDMTHDVVTLNEFLNQTAMNSNWCGDYEARQRRYNSGFRVIRLEGRTSADYANWERRHNRQYRENAGGLYPLAMEQEKAAVDSAQQRARWEFARLMVTGTLKGTLPESRRTPAPAQNSDFVSLRTRLIEADRAQQPNTDTAPAAAQARWSGQLHLLDDDGQAITIPQPLDDNVPVTVQAQTYTPPAGQQLVAETTETGVVLRLYPEEAAS